MDTAILPLAITMMAGPQILSAIIFVTGDQPVKVSLAYVAGVGLAAGASVLFWYLLAGALHLTPKMGSEPSTASKIVSLVLVGVLILASVKAWLGRETAEPPKWLGSLQDSGWQHAFRLGLLLILLMPSDLVIAMTTGAHLQSGGHAYSEGLPFIGLTALIAALPIIFYLLFRRRAAVAMPKVRDWMNANSALVNIAVYVIFIVLIVA
jgi:Sap, sulfolipid-1-addressing protein